MRIIDRSKSLVSVNKEAVNSSESSPSFVSIDLETSQSQTTGVVGISGEAQSQSPPSTGLFQRSQHSYSLPSISTLELVKSPEFHTDAYSLRTVYHKAPDDTSSTLRWSQSAKSIYKDTQKEQLNWRGKLRIQCQSLFDKFKRSRPSESVNCLTPPHLPRPPDKDQ